jgi:hypothetical protein
MPRVSLPKTTRTLELSQLAELNSRLNEPGPRITASEIGLADLPESAVLERLCWDGPPDYPYVHAHFALVDRVEGAHRKPKAGPMDSRIVDLHTGALRQLSRRLGMRQQWGATGEPT